MRCSRVECGVAAVVTELVKCEDLYQSTSMVYSGLIGVMGIEGYWLVGWSLGCGEKEERHVSYGSYLSH